MIEPFGIEQKSLSTSLGQMVYYTPTAILSPPTPETKPPLIFLHGFGGGSSAYEWSKVYPAFAPDYQVIAPDLIGWGRSEHPQRDYQPQDYLTILEEFIENISPQGAAVVASSLTAALTIRVAIQRPDLFRCLILTTPSGLSDFGEDYRQSFFAQVVKTPWLDRFLYWSAIATVNGITSFLTTRQFAQPERIQPEIINAYLASAQQPHAEYAALSFVRGDLCFDLARYLPALTTPTAILWGEKAQFTPIETGRRLAALNPTAIQYFQELPQVGLTPQLEVPTITIALLRNYLKNLTKPSGKFINLTQ